MESQQYVCLLEEVGGIQTDVILKTDKGEVSTEALLFVHVGADYNVAVDLGVRLRNEDTGEVKEVPVQFVGQAFAGKNIEFVRTVYKGTVKA